MTESDEENVNLGVKEKLRFKGILNFEGTKVWVGSERCFKVMD